MTLRVVYRFDVSSPNEAENPHGGSGLLRVSTALALSLVRALSDSVIKDVHLTTYAQGLSRSSLSDLCNVLDLSPFDFEVIQENPHHTPSVEPFFNTLQKSHLFDYVFFVENGCLLDPDAIGTMLADYKMMTAMNGEDLILTPFDRLDLYKTPHDSVVVAGQKCYWRTVAQTRKTTFMSRRAYNRVWQHFLDFGDKRHSLIQPPIAVLSPMPSLGCSIFEDQPLPFISPSQWLAEGDMSHPMYRKLHIPPGIV